MRATSRQHPARLGWTASLPVRRYLHRLATGDSNCDWLTWVRSRHMPSVVERTLVLGRGSGWIERALAQKNGFRRILAREVDGDAGGRAQTHPERTGEAAIEYRVVDLENGPLPPGPWDAIIANDVLHGVTDLEGLFARIHDVLKPGGLFLFNEYVGPNRFQYGDDRMELVNRYFRLLPERLRRDSDTGESLWKRERENPIELAESDPTEAVRSEDLLPLARETFEVEAEYPYGGGLLHPLLSGVASNFRDGTPEDDRLLEVLCAAEDRLTRAGLVDPDFHIFVGRQRGRMGGVT